MKRVEACVSVTINQECSEICTWRFLFFPRDLISPFLRRANSSTSLLTSPVEKFGRTDTSCVAQRAICQCLCVRRCCSNAKLLWRLLAAPLRRAPVVFCSAWRRGRRPRYSNVQRQPEVGDEWRLFWRSLSVVVWPSGPPARPVCGKNLRACQRQTKKRLKNQLFAGTLAHGETVRATRPCWHPLIKKFKELPSDFVPN